jgi:hypothetical protein
LVCAVTHPAKIGAAQIAAIVHLHMRGSAPTLRAVTDTVFAPDCRNAASLERNVPTNSTD